MSTIQNTAIILHGPPGVGKTSISQEIQRRCPSGMVNRISLDEYWLSGQRRYLGELGRYSDLRAAQEPVVVIELGCGEPPDLTFAGATRGAEEWVRVLRDTGRAIFPFRIWCEFSEAANRLDERYAGRSDKLFWVWRDIGLYALYEHQHAIATFPAIPEFHEVRISTSGRSLPDVADEIIRRSGLQ